MFARLGVNGHGWGEWMGDGGFGQGWMGGVVMARGWMVMDVIRLFLFSFNVASFFFLMSISLFCDGALVWGVVVE